MLSSNYIWKTDLIRTRNGASDGGWTIVQFKSRNPKVKVNGETVLSVVSGMELFRSNALNILKNNNIENPQSGMWYKK
jgi:hypothetical protein